jgi:hypothetical protein
MTSVSVKSTAILELMRHLPVPWSTAVDQVISSMINSCGDAHYASQLQEQYQLLELRRILLRYELSDVNVANLALIRGNV